MTLSERLDAFAEAVSPRWAASRAEGRQRLALVEHARKRFDAKLSAWEAADNDRFRGSKWLVSRLSSNSALEQERETLVERSEDLFRNDCFAASAVNGRVDNVVGRGIRVQSRITAKETGLTEDQAEAVNERLEQLFAQVAAFERLYLQQRLAERCCGIYGESIEVLSDVGGADKPVPLSTQVVSPNRLQTPPGRVGDKRIRMGVEIDARGTPVAYWIRRAEPNDTLDINHQFDRVPASRVLHTFEPMFPGQLRGVPWMAPGMANLKDLKDFVEAHLIGEQVSACFAAFVKTTNAGSVARFNATTTDSDGRRIEDLAPGAIQYLNADEDVTFSNPARPGNTLGPYVDHHLKGFAAAIRYPFELLTKTYDNSYSGGRLSLIDGRVAFGCWQRNRIEMSCVPLWHRFVDECVMLGLVPEIDPAEYAANPWPWRHHQWIPPGMEWIDPNVDAKSNESAVENGFKAKSAIIAGLGGDFDEVLEARTRERIAELRAEARIRDETKRLGLATEPEETEEPEPAGAAA